MTWREGGGRDGSELAGTLAAIALAVIDGSRTARAPVPSQRRRRRPSGGAADKKTVGVDQALTKSSAER